MRVEVGRDQGGQFVRDAVGLIALNGDVDGFPEHGTQRQNRQDAGAIGHIAAFRRDGYGVLRGDYGLHEEARRAGVQSDLRPHDDPSL